MSSTNLVPIYSHLLQATVNGMLDLFQEHEALPWRIPAEGRLATALDVSRSTVRSALAYLRDRSLISGQGRYAKLATKPLKKYYFKLDCSALYPT